jgi:hypothetical protein
MDPTKLQADPRCLGEVSPMRIQEQKRRIRKQNRRMRVPYPWKIFGHTRFGEGFGCRTLSSVSFSNSGRDRFFFFVVKQAICSSLWEPTGEKENYYSSESASSLWDIVGSSPASPRGTCACAPVVGFASRIRCVFFKTFKNVAIIVKC